MEQDDFVISVSGDSMAPTCYVGDKVFVEKCDAVDDGGIRILILDDKAYIKELGNNKYDFV